MLCTFVGVLLGLFIGQAISFAIAGAVLGLIVDGFDQRFRIRPARKRLDNRPPRSV